MIRVGNEVEGERSFEGVRHREEEHLAPLRDLESVSAVLVRGVKTRKQTLRFWLSFRFSRSSIPDLSRSSIAFIAATASVVS